MSTTFSDNDNRLLDKTLQIRERIVDNLLTRELPVSPREIEAFTNLLESVDRSVLGKAKIKIDDANSQANEETKNMLRSLIIDLHKDVNKSNLPPGETRSSLEYQPSNSNVNDGEIIPKMDTIDVKSILERQ